jgi:hypothetical protein
MEQRSAWQLIATLPEIAWEASLGIYLIVKGFKPSPIIAMGAADQDPDSASREARLGNAKAPAAPRLGAAR